MSVYTASFSGVAVAAAQDLFEITAGNNYVLLRRVVLGQYSDAGDAEAENLAVKFIRGHTTGGTGGSTLTPYRMSQQAAQNALATVKANNTTEASSGSQEVVWSEAWSVGAGYIYHPTICMPARKHAQDLGLFVIQPDERFVINLPTAPADEITMSGSIEFEEVKRL